VVDCQRHLAVALSPGKTPVLNVQEAGWGPGPVQMSVQYLFPTGIRIPNRQARGVRYTNYGIPTPKQYVCSKMCVNRYVV